MGNYIVGAIFILVLVLALRYTIKQAKRGSCAGCNRNCNSCPNKNK